MCEDACEAGKAAHDVGLVLALGDVIADSCGSDLHASVSEESTNVDTLSTSGNVSNDSLTDVPTSANVAKALTNPVVCDESRPDLDTSSSAQALPAFTGQWVLKRFEGDMDKFLKSSNVSYLQRTAAKALNYGVGVQKCEITQHGDELRLKVTAPGVGKTYRSTMRTDGVELQEKDPSGRPVLVTSTLQGQSIETCMRDPTLGAPSMFLRRWLADGDMFVHMRTASGCQVTRVFSRQ